MHGEYKKTEVFTDGFCNSLLNLVNKKMFDSGFRGQEFHVWEYLYFNSFNLKICISRKLLAKKLDMNICSIGAPLTKLKKYQYIKITRRKTNTGKCLSSQITVTLPASLIAELQQSKKFNHLIKEFL
ncbi:MAG: hypothetical protein HRT87_05175 [Legionellales bacterium]|nr:hypothetical protein [Legionellales bacterium]